MTGRGCQICAPGGRLSPPVTQKQTLGNTTPVFMLYVHDFDKKRKIRGKNSDKWLNGAVRTRIQERKKHDTEKSNDKYEDK